MRFNFFLNMTSHLQTFYTARDLRNLERVLNEPKPDITALQELRVQVLMRYLL